MNPVLWGMKTPFTIKEFRNPTGSIAFRVYGKKSTGEIVRENFKKLELAVARRQELEIESLNQTDRLVMRPTRLSSGQLADAESACLRLASTNHTLVDCVEYFLKTWRADILQKSLDQAFQEFMADKKAANLREDSLTNLRVRVGRFVTAHPDKLVSQIQPADIKAAINRTDWSPVMRVNERRVLFNFFRWTMKQGYRSENPVAKIDPPKLERNEPEILQLDEVISLLRAARDYKDGLLLAHVCLALFTGLRPSELRRISRSDIDMPNNLVIVKGGAAKLRQRRVIELSDNLTKWLQLCGGQAITPKTNFQKHLAEVRRLAGFSGGLGTDEDKNLKEWGVDVLRHTAISFWQARFKNEGACADWEKKPSQVERSAPFYNLRLALNNCSRAMAVL